MGWGRSVWMAVGIGLGCSGSGAAVPDGPADAATDAATPPPDAPDPPDAGASCGGPAAGTTVTLSPRLQLAQFFATPDSRDVVFFGDPVIEGALALYAVPIGGGAPVQLSQSFGPGTTLLGQRLSPDGAHVVWVADPGVLGRYRLYRAPLDGSTITELYDVAGDQVEGFAVSPTSDRVVFVTRGPTGVVLRSIPIAGGVVTPLSPEPGQGLIGEWEFTPDGSRVVFYADTDEVAETFRVYSVPTAGGALQALSPPGLVDARLPRLAPDGTTVVFRGLASESEPAILHTVPATGGTATPLPETTGVGFFWTITPDASAVLFLSPRQVDYNTRLYRAPLAGGPATLLSHDILPDPNLQVWDFTLSPDGSRVVFWGDADWPEVSRVYSVPAAGGGIVTLSSYLGTGDAYDAGNAIVAPGSDVVVFGGDLETDELLRVYAAPIDGGSMAILSPNAVTDPPDPSRRASMYQVSSRRDVLYLTNVDVVDQSRLYRTNLDVGVAEPVSPVPAVAGATVYYHAPTPDGCWAVYQGDLDEDERLSLYATKLW